MSVLSSHYPRYEPGLCGALVCRRTCSRVCHCEAGMRLIRARLAAQAVRRFRVIANQPSERSLCRHS